VPLTSSSCSVSPTHCSMSLISPGGFFVSKCNSFCLLWSNSCLGTQNLSLWMTACVWGQKSTREVVPYSPVLPNVQTQFWHITRSYSVIKNWMCIPMTNVLVIKIIVKVIIVKQARGYKIAQKWNFCIIYSASFCLKLVWLYFMLSATQLKIFKKK